MKKVLIVEDELSIANFIVDIIQTLGYNTKIITSGSKVLSAVKEWGPDLITLDIMIPSPDGLQVLHQIKTDPDIRSVPVFVVSVLAEDSKQQGKLNEADGVFQKPIDTKKFIEGMQKVLEPTY